MFKSSRPFKLQTKCCGFWLTLRRARTIQGIYDWARHMDAHPGVYRIVGGGLSPHVWKTPEAYFPDAPEVE